MNIYVWKYTKEQGFQTISLIDYAISVIWIRRYQESGEFELYLPATAELFSLFLDDLTFLTKEDEIETAMKVESVQLTTDPEEGDRLIVSGRSAECILSQRIVFHKFDYSGYVDECIYQLVTENAVNPTRSPSPIMNGNRKIEELTIGTGHFSESSITTQLNGENLLEAIQDICVSADFGFQVIFTGTGFVFRLYQGNDRTQNVIFSPEFENVGSTEYLYDMTTYYNLIQETGDFNGTRYRAEDIESSEIGGLYLREKHIDAESIETDETTTVSNFIQILRQRAKQNRYQAKEKKDFSGEVVNTDMYQYGQDYNLGDKVSIVNGYGIEGTATITEITETEDVSGYRLIPTFSDWKVIT